MGVVSPNGIGNQAFCRAVLDGVSGVKRVRSFDPSELPVQIAGEVQGFDELAWVDAHERKHVSRVVPLALAASTEALRDARIDVASLSLEQQREIGVVLGSGGGAQEFSEEQVRLWLTGKVKQVSLFCIPSGTMGTLSSEVSMRFGLARNEPRHHHGVHVVDGCIWLCPAADSIRLPADDGGRRRGRSDRARNHEGLHADEDHDSSWNEEPERASRPFSLDRDGFVVAEGAWMFCLEEYEHARARGAKSWQRSPDTDRPVRLFIACGCRSAARSRRVRSRWRWKMPGSERLTIDYVNLHGTSTQLNDRIETRALKLALGEKASRTPMSSLKSQIGHPQGACGAAGIAATLVAMHHGQVPPTINLEHPDPECDLDYVPEVGRRVEIEHAVCNCIAFGSKNSALVLRKLG